MKSRTPLIVLLVLAGMAFSPWMIRTFVPGLPSLLEGRPSRFYVLTQFTGESSPRLLAVHEQPLSGDWVLDMNCVASHESWVPDGGLVDRIELQAKANDRFVMDVYQDDLGGQAETFEYLCRQGQYLPLSSSEDLLGIPLPAYGLLTKGIFWALWLSLGLLLWRLLRKKKGQAV